MQKRKPIRIPKLLKAAENESCTLRFEGCTNRNVVACHSNYGFHGKGMGQKADDIFIAFGCEHCHSKLDGRLQDKETRLKVWVDYKYERFYQAMCETWRRLVEKGMLK